MGEWRDYKISDIADVIGGGTPKTAIDDYWNGDIPWLAPRDLSDYDKVYISNGDRFITEAGLKNSSTKIMPKGSVLLTSRAPIGYVVIAENNVDYLQQLGSGTTFAEISGAVVKDIDISLPPLKEQKAIAEVLSSLDDKIDLLHRQNKTLEELAQTLFREWFIEEAGDEWELCKLSDILEIKYGKDHKKLADGNIPVYGSGGIMRYANSFLYDKESILIPRKGTLTNLFYIDEPFWTVDTIFWSKVNNEKVSGKFLFSFLKTMDLSNLNVGSAVPSLTTKVLNEIKILLPSLEEQKEFNEYADNAWEKMKKNKIQIKTLENMRDTLLPKLMSGEVRIKD